MKLNIVFQGGGANVVTLMAAASALENVLSRNENSDIKIETITGVSAGAIVASMLGSPVAVSEYRGIAEQEARKVIDKLSIKKRYQLPEKMGKRNFWKYRSLAWALLKGEPLLDEKDISDLFKNIFQNQAIKQIQTLSDIDIPIFITATDLRKNDRVSFNKKSHPTLLLEKILTHSTAIPFVFRSFNSNQELADGGLSGNLPIGLLDRMAGENSRILAFGFKGGKVSNDSNILAYCSRILSASIDGAVSQNTKRIKASGGKIIELEKKFSLVGFDRAIDEGLGASEFKIIAAEIEKIIEKRIIEMKVDGRRHKNATEIRASIQQAYQYLEDNSFIKKASRVTICKLDSLNPLTPDDAQKVDKLRQEIHFYPDEGGAQVVSANLVLLSVPGIERGSSEVVDSARNPINFVKFDATSEVAEDDSRTYLNSVYVLNRNYTEDDDHFIVSQTTTGMLCPDFGQYGYDYTRHRPNLAAGTAEYVAIFLVPKKYTARENLELLDLNEYSKLIEIKENKKIPNLDEMANNWNGGRALSNKEVSKYLGVTDVGDYHALGWIVENIPENEYCGVFVVDCNLISRADLKACK